MEVWVGLIEVTQIPGDQLITLELGAGFTWFTCWADSAEGFQTKATEVMRFYGLHLIGCDQVSAAYDRVGVEGELLDRIERTRESHAHSLFGTFHTYPPQYS